MMNKPRAMTIVLLLMAMFLAACQRPRQADKCAVCNRPVHSGMAAMYSDNGKPQTACCAACALAYERQTGKNVQIQQVTDYITGQALKPQDAMFVVGSDEHPCSHQQVMLTEPRRLPLHYDRCEPSVLAFREAGQAQNFAREHDGQVRTWAQVAAMVKGAAQEEKKP